MMKKIFVIGASAAGLESLQQICAALPADLPCPVLIVMHVGAFESQLPAVLARRSRMPVRHAEDGQRIENSVILVAPSDRHMLVQRDGQGARIKLSTGARENFTRPAIDPLFRSAAAQFGSLVVGVVLSGYLDDGTVGLKAIKDCGGFAIAQEPLGSPAPDMPSSAIENVDVDLILEVEAIAPALVNLASEAVMAQENMPQAQAQVPEWVRVENKFAENHGQMADLQNIASVSPYSCPECSGNLWELKDGNIKRFRCHTGHSYTADALAKLQQRTVEDALWVALRALHEQQALATQRAAEVSPMAAKRHHDAAAHAAHAANIIRKLLEF